MRTMIKFAATVAIAGALAAATMTPSEARDGWNAAAIGVGVGAVTGAAVASSAYNNGYYGYYNEPGYAYAPGYAYGAPYANGSYAYAPPPRYKYYYGDGWSDQ